MKYSRALWIWCSFVPVVILNAAFREVILNPTIGALAAHIVSTMIGVILLFGITLLAIAWIGPERQGDVWRVGVMWLLLTIAFEFLAGHYVFGTSWEKLLADYNLLRGRVWLLVLVGQLFSPWLAVRIQRKFSALEPRGRHHLGSTVRS